MNMNVPVIPESKPQAYVINVYSERSGSDIHRVTDATIEELQDIVVFMHTQLEESKRLTERSLSGVNRALGYDEI